MNTALRFERTVRRIEMMLHEIKLIEIDAHDIVDELDEFHRQLFSEFDILDDEAWLAERSASDRASKARTLLSACSQLSCDFESEIRHLRERNPFA